jgi:hypothetical protein
MSDFDTPSVKEIQEAKRKKLVADLVSDWNTNPDKAAKKLWEALKTIMEFVGSYPGFAGADKRRLALDTFHEVLQQTNSPGPDFVVDPAILWAMEYGVDYLYDAFKGKFDFGSSATAAPSPTPSNTDDIEH